jgi:hypothetical protein
MKIAITGISGFVGQNLKMALSSDEVITIKRDISEVDLCKLLESVDVVINLAGSPIIARWSEEYKKVLYNSRIDTTKKLIDAFSKISKKPSLFISTSAIGIYDNKGIYDEYNTNYGDDFLSNLCKDWEKKKKKAQNFGIRTAIFRFGIILGQNGGALQKMLTPFKLGIGGCIGDGSQKFSFIHIDDLVNAFLFVIRNSNINGTFNLTAPVPTTNYGLTKALGKTLHRPTIFNVPEFILKIIFSEGAKVLTDGQSVIPKRLIESGFEFKYKTIEEAIENLLK